MTSPDASQAEQKSQPLAMASANATSWTTLRNRSDFLITACAQRCSAPGMVVQGRHRDDQSPNVRIGFTCSKKVGNAVQRNRAKRRLREVVRQVCVERGQPGWDYVLIGRAATTLARPFSELCTDFQTCLASLHSKGAKT